ncbi:hypothetical protein K402DRAFT_322999 [Aulographum hederae CBS 113979]|uniref:Carbohydrate esterase family 16 protein n=1 Tax=Aulographum hederae CBS 113979 TaxID=1176131 RepID=A0A6G1HE78_9PEZI|nr:hypothetical protein K402DRAFT_322999 [Aulographum hederae CBS 113979]
MRFWIRHALVALCVLVLLTFCLSRSAKVRIQTSKVLKGTSPRLVVFGDSHSDTGKRLESPLVRQAEEIVRDARRGAIWTERLCRELLCDNIDNFARGRALIDNSLNSAETSQHNSPLPSVDDFHSQVQRWSDFEKQKCLIPGRCRGPERTIFTVYFGAWDLWEYVELDLKTALMTINRSIDELFTQLDFIAEHSRRRPRIIMPTLWDPSFMPAFRKRNVSSSALDYADSQQMMIALVEHWNKALRSAALSWTSGDIYMPDWNQWFMDQLRAKQRQREKVAGAKGAGRMIKSHFKEVQVPCSSMTGLRGDVVGSGSDSETTAETGTYCDDPEKYLFWDDMHLSGTAHTYLGREAAIALRKKRIVNTALLRHWDRLRNEYS